MTPKSALFTAGTTDLTGPKPLGRKPITTQERLQVAAYNRTMAAKPEALSPPRDITTPTKKCKSKAIPPPGEAFQEPSAKEKAKMTGLNSKRRKPITTQERLRAAEINKTVLAGVKKKKKADAREAAKEVGREVTEGKEKAEKEKERTKNEKAKVKKKTQSNGGAKKIKEYQSSPLSVLTMGTVPTATRFEDRMGKGVLMRPTERAKAEKRGIDMRAQAANEKFIFGSNIKTTTVFKAKAERKPFRLMELPEEVRNRIWKLVVVHTPFCVWPGQAKGREQPDLAMSGREVRDEVLPVFYSGNFFGLDITPRQQPAAEEAKGDLMGGPEELNAEDRKAEEQQKAKAAVKCPAWIEEQRGYDRVPKQVMGNAASAKSAAQHLPDLLEEIKPWVRALEASGSLSKIQHWIFSSSPDLPLSNDNTSSTRILQIDIANSLVVYLNIWHKDGLWRANVEVHREACCVLPGQADFGRCVVQSSPFWLNGIVGMVLQKAERRGITAEMLVGLGKALRARADELVDVRCSGAANRSDRKAHASGS